MNIPLITSLVAIMLAQLIKYPISFFYARQNAKLSIITSTGGMPSSHSAAVSSLITALALEYGFSSAYVSIATVLGLIVMFDSMGVRRQSGDQGLVIEALVRHTQLVKHQSKLEVNEAVLSTTDEVIDEESYNKLIVKKYKGHTPLEVIVGVILGALVATLIHSIVY